MLSGENEELRYAVIGGVARIAARHFEALARLPVRVVALSDIDVERGARRARETGTSFFADHKAMLTAIRPDVAIVCTPHPSHAPIAIDCLRAGAHVLAEKPIADAVGPADDAVRVAAEEGRILGVNHPERFRPAIEFAKGAIARGELGRITRVLAVEPWLRNAAYYQSSPWRATWQGEGGGVLMNQAPHMLDVLGHLMGLPARVWGMARTRVHDIECEDSAQAMFEYADGAFAYVATSTIEAGVEQQMEIVGDRAVLQIMPDTVRLTRLERSVRDHVTRQESGPPATATEVVPLAEGEPGMLAVHRDFLAAVRERRAPRCDGRSALMSLELANAILLSSF
ncbi:MAG TPA: Gfo/Idh/MocA family oxidoreductase, partial [Polyangiaceae bacterium]